MHDTLSLPLPHLASATSGAYTAVQRDGAELPASRCPDLLSMAREPLEPRARRRRRLRFSATGSRSLCPEVQRSPPGNDAHFPPPPPPPPPAPSLGGRGLGSLAPGAAARLSPLLPPREEESLGPGGARPSVPAAMGGGGRAGQSGVPGVALVPGRPAPRLARVALSLRRPDKRPGSAGPRAADWAGGRAGGRDGGGGGRGGACGRRGRWPRRAPPAARLRGSSGPGRSAPPAAATENRAPRCGCKLPPRGSEPEPGPPAPRGRVGQ